MRSVLARLATVAVAVAVAALIVPATALAVVPRASLTDIENDVMCVACREPLAVSQSPEADAERSYIQGLIAQGETKAQIERALVGQYGPTVLGRPPAHGLNLAVYILPPAVLLAGIIALAITLPRWRRRAREAATVPLPAGPPLSAADATRLEEDLTGYER
jgi:cytochrome c-type biogenesis protein CcmH